MRWFAAAIATTVLALVAWCMIPLSSRLGPGPRDKATHYWTLANGHRIGYTRIAARPASAKPPIVFLHGGPGAHVQASTVEVIAGLADLGHDIYFYDQAGSGASDRLARPSDYSFLGHVDDLHDIVTERIGASTIVLIGQSFGGRLAAHFATVHPELIDRLILCSPAQIEPSHYDENGRNRHDARYPVPADLVFSASATKAGEPGVFSGLPLRAVAAVLVATLFDVKLMSDQEADGVLDDLLDSQVRDLSCDPANAPRDQPGSGFYARLGSAVCPRRDDPRAGMASMEAPVLVMQGLCDPIISYAMAYEYVDLFPNAEYESFTGAGHVIWWDRPECYIERLSRFVRDGLDHGDDPRIAPRPPA